MQGRGPIQDQLQLGLAAPSACSGWGGYSSTRLAFYRGIQIRCIFVRAFLDSRDPQILRTHALTKRLYIW